jgi:hypothetical protein
MKRLIVVAMLLPTVAFAQPTTQVAAPPAELVLKVTPDEVNIISEGLQEMSIRKALPLINKLRQQIMDQQPKPVAPAEAPK